MGPSQSSAARRAVVVSHGAQSVEFGLADAPTVLALKAAVARSAELGPRVAGRPFGLVVDSSTRRGWLDVHALVGIDEADGCVRHDWLSDGERPGAGDRLFLVVQDGP